MRAEQDRVTLLLSSLALLCFLTCLAAALYYKYRKHQQQQQLSDEKSYKEFKFCIRAYQESFCPLISM